MRALLALVLVAALGAGAGGPLDPESGAPAEVAGAGAALPPQCPAAAGARCRYRGSEHDEYFFEVDGVRVQVSYSAAYVSLRCGGGALDSPALPRFPRLRPAPRVRLSACAPPAPGPDPGGEYAAALRGLNVTCVPGGALQLDALPAAPALGPRSLRGLPALAALALAGPERGPPPALPADLLVPLDASLAALHLRLARAPAGLRLPRALRRLAAAGPGLAARLGPGAPPPGLAELQLADAELTAPPPVSAGGALTDLSLDAPLEALPPLSGVVNLTLSRVRAVSLRGECGSLERLRVSAVSAALPGGWLAGCARLQLLQLDAVPGAAAAPRALLAACPGLRDLALRRCGLTRLPDALRAPLPQLRRLDLTRNRIETLDSAVFASLPALEELHLSHNALSGADADTRLALGALPALRVLDLARNPLGDLCPQASANIDAQELSAVSGLSRLESLSLSGSGATRLCADWRRDLRALRSLDLRHNAVAALTLRDLQWAPRRGPGAGPARVRVDLAGNPLAALTVQRAQYERLAAAGRPRELTVEVSLGSGRGALRCDCAVYWAWRALSEGLLPAALRPPPACAAPAQLAGAALAALHQDEMVCEAGGEACAAGCACVWRPRDNATVATCARAGLSALPRVPPLAARLVLNATGNRIASLHVGDLAPHLAHLDLSGNALEAPDEAALGALLARPEARLWLARNPLRCACADRRALLLLRAHSSQVRDYGAARCADGRALAEAAADVAAGCGAGAGGAVAWDLAWGAGLALAGALAAAGASCAAWRRDARLPRKAAAAARAVCRVAHDTTRERSYEYDVFVSYSHEDEAVAEQIRAALEDTGAGAGAGGLTLCMQHRDWRAGDWIPAQVSRCVSVSRRTLVLVSAHWTRSASARPELCAVYERALDTAASRRRLVLVALGGGAPAGLAPRLPAPRARLVWGDRGFWPALRRALPRAPRAPPNTRPPLRPHLRPPTAPAPSTPAPTPAPPAPAPPQTPVVSLAPHFTPQPKRKLAETSPCA